MTVLLTFTGCIVIDRPFSGLPPGAWRAVLKFEPVPVTPNPRGEPLPEKLNLQYEEVTQGELPFNFEVIYDNEHQFHLELRNGDQRIRIDDLSIGTDRETAKDTLLIRFPGIDSSFIRARYEQNIIEGEWITGSGETFAVPFVARFGQDYRFTNLRKPPAMNLSGRWEVDLGADTNAPYPAVAEFQQQGNHLTASFFTRNDQYQHLEGTVQAGKFYLSFFDGNSALLLEGKIQADSSIIGSFRIGRQEKTLWEARRNPAAQLPADSAAVKADGL